MVLLKLQLAYKFPFIKRVQLSLHISHFASIKFFRALLFNIFSEEAFKIAVSLAKSKAVTVSHTLGVQLGSILNLVEERLVEREEEEEGEPGKQLFINVSNFTSVTYTSTVCALFEVLPVKRKK